MADNNDHYSEIAMLVHRYADAVVHRNGEQWSSTWAEDAAVSYTHLTLPTKA